MAVTNLVKKIQNIMRKDSGVDGDAQRIGQMVWMFFLKIYDAKEDDWALDDSNYKSIIPEELRWRNWACHKDADGKETKCMTGDELLNFINNVLFPVLKGENVSTKRKKVTDQLDENGNPVVENEVIEISGLKVDRNTPRYKAIVYEVFAEALNYMKNGQYLREVINIIDDVDFYDTDESHAFGDLYESILKDLQSAGHAGEFYTPRALTDLIIKILDPHIGELVGDFAMGTGGFLISALRHLEPQCQTNEDLEKFQQSVIGQEWKPLPYLLGVTNVMLHDIKNPNLRHMDSLGVQMSNYRESGKADVIAMNPPYGGATDESTKLNFKEAYRSSETADLFIVLIMQRLARGGRAGVIVPDGFLFGNDNAKINIKARLLKEFNLHTIIRLPGSIFNPYTGIATNILFFDNKKADDAEGDYATARTWFYRMDMPEGYINFSKTRPMKLEHAQCILDWWNDRKEIISEDGTDEKSRSFTPAELEAMSYNFDLCKFPNEQEEILAPDELLRQYHEKRAALESEIHNRLENIQRILNNSQIEAEDNTHQRPWTQLSELHLRLPESLKKSYLQQAIMGKLVPQDPKDEPASELLKRIREEKKKLVDCGKLKKKDLDTTPISDEEKPFEIPEGWEWVRGSSIFVETKNRVPTEEFFMYIDTDAVNNKTHIVTPKRLKSSEASSRARRILSIGDVIYSKVRPYLQNIALIDTPELASCIGSTGFYVMRSTGVFVPKFLFYLTLTPYVTNGINSFLKGEKSPAVKDEVIKDFIYPLPPLAEQHRIVEKLEEILSKLKEI